MTKKNKNRLGIGMKPRQSPTPTSDELASTSLTAGQEKAEKEAISSQNVEVLAENCASKQPENRDSLEPILSVFEAEKDVADDPEEEPKTVDLLEDLLRKSANPEAPKPIVVAPRDGVVEQFHTMLGDRPDGTFGIVVSIREGLIDPIRQQAGYDKQTPEEWVSERFGEYIDQWWSPAESR